MAGCREATNTLPEGVWGKKQKQKQKQKQQEHLKDICFVQLTTNYISSTLTNRNQKPYTATISFTFSRFSSNTMSWRITGVKSVVHRKHGIQNEDGIMILKEPAYKQDGKNSPSPPPHRRKKKVGHPV